jgi:hypothetical protein
VTDADNAVVDVINPAININKVTSDGVSTGDDITVEVGTPITWIYEVTNVGDVGLANVEVIDNQGVTPELDLGESIGAGDGILDLDDKWIYTASGTAIKGEYNNVGTATGEFTDDLGNTATVSADDSSSYVGECPPCEFDIFESFSGPDINVTIKIEEYVDKDGNDAGVKFTVTETDPDLIGDIRGVFFHVDPDRGDLDPLTGLVVTGADVTEFRVGEDSINDLGGGANMKGDGGYRYEESEESGGDIIKGHKYDVGVEIGTQGIGNDDIQSTMFTVSNPNLVGDDDLNVENFADVEFGVRLTSVGSESKGGRGQSSKVFGLSDCPCFPDSEGLSDIFYMNNDLFALNSGDMGPNLA